MILHFAPDSMFAPFLQGIFDEACANNNIWRFYSEKPQLSFALSGTSTSIINDGYFTSDQFRRDLKQVDCLIFHSLFLSNPQKAAVLFHLPISIPVIWRGWGYDYYEFIYRGGIKFLLPETASLIEPLQGNATLAMPLLSLQRVKSMARKFAGKVVNRKFVSRVDYFSCCVPGDFDSLSNALPAFRAKFLPLNYYSMEDVFLQGVGTKELRGRDILLGNSAAVTNNHIEAFRLLAETDLSERRVLVPLNYGDMKYRELVLKYGEDLLGRSFVPITDFMPLSEYNELISSCGTLVMNSMRQQAMGNISAVLLRGGKVFLRPDNPIFKYYRRLGAKVFSLIGGGLALEINSPINEVDAIRNREILTDIWARRRAVEQAESISGILRNCF